MKQKPSIDEEELKHLIKSKYDIDVEKLHFVPLGEVAYSYVVQTSTMTYFSKLYESNNLTKKGIYNLETSMNTVSQLNKKDEIKQIINPILNNDKEFRTIIENYSLILMSYIEGETVSEKLSKTEKFLTQLGELLAKIHNTTNGLELKHIKLFEINLDFKEDLLLSIKEATACTVSKDKNFNKLQKLIKSNIDYILPALVYLEELAENLKQEDKFDLVICHTDPNRNNIIINKKEQIHLIDWDGIALAPFERDIWFYINEKNHESFIDGYTRIRDVTSINEDLVVYLFYHRVLDDLTDWIYRILFEDISKEQIKSDFDGLQEDVWPLLPNMKEIEKILRYNCKKWVKIE
ncbi:MAG: phosphotransferase [Candidatus Heimdallarchaeaceae archaeon]